MARQRNFANLPPWSFLALAGLALTLWSWPARAEDPKTDKDSADKTAAQEQRAPRQDTRFAGGQNSPAVIRNNPSPDNLPAQGRMDNPNTQPAWRNAPPSGNPRADTNNYPVPRPAYNNGQRDTGDTPRIGLPERAARPSLQNNPAPPQWGAAGNARVNPRGREVGIPERINTDKRRNVDAPSDNSNYPIYQPAQPAQSDNQGWGNQTRRNAVQTDRSTRLANPTQKTRLYSNQQALQRGQTANETLRNNEAVRNLPPANSRSAQQVKFQQKAAWTQNVQTKIRQNNIREAEKRRQIPLKYVVRKPDGTQVKPVEIDRHRNPVVEDHFNHIRHRFGDPCFGFSFLPRPVSIFSDGFWFGYEEGFSDGYFTGLHFGSAARFHRSPVFLSFYYPSYFDDPYFTGFWYNGYYPSIYHYYGWVPRWIISPAGLVVYHLDPYPFAYAQPVYYLERPQVDEPGVNQVLRGIQQAWLDSDIDRLSDYIRQDEKISVYFDNDYSYSISGADYYQMTLDAMSTIKTVSMEFDDPIWVNANEVFFTGRHIFYNPDNERQTVYVSFRLHRYSGDWSIISVGSSPKPIKADGLRDFRY